MTPGRHTTRLTLLALVAALLAVGLGALVVLLRPGRERPADVAPTPPVLVVTTEPTRPIPVQPSATPEPTETLPRMTSTPAPTATVAPPTAMPTQTTAPSETRAPIQRG